ncbi:hypothetical protein JHK86_055035 [Glycine max]|nr:hypothetical protein JHK86_055035 [Glycine max]
MEGLINGAGCSVRTMIGVSMAKEKANNKVGFNCRSINSNGFTGPIPAAIVLKEYLHSAELRDIMQCSTRMKHATNEDRDGRNCTGAGGLNDSRLGVLQEPSDGLTVGLVAELSG